MRELRRAIGYDAEHVVNAALPRLVRGAPRAGRGDRGGAALTLGSAGCTRPGVAALAVRDLAEGHYRDAYARLKPFVDDPFLQVTPLQYPDFVEAAVRSGHGATRPAGRSSRLERARGRPTARRGPRAVAERCRALVDDDRGRGTTRRRSRP